MIKLKCKYNFQQIKIWNEYKGMKKMIPNILENDYLKGNCVLFVGAGISARIKRNNGTNVPNWKE